MSCCVRTSARPASPARAILASVEPRDRILGPVAYETGRDTHGEPSVIVDFGSLIRKLIVSEQVIVESILLKEIPLLIQKFGYDGVKELLGSGRVRFLQGGLFFANLGQYAARTNGPVLPLGSYSFSALTAGPRPGDLRRVGDLPGLSAKQAKKLRLLTRRALSSFPDDAGHDSEEQLKSDLEANVPLLKSSVALAARQRYSVDIEPASFDLRIERLTEWDWRTETDLGKKTGLGAEQIHEVVGNGLSAVGGLNLRFERMKTFSALTGFRANELPLMEQRYDFLMRQLDPDAHEARFERVCEIAGLPDVDPDPSVNDVDLARLLKITASPEAEEFRRWLRGVDSFTDEELAAAFHPVRDTIGSAVRSPGGKAVRLATATGVGVLLPPAGIGLSVIDTFLTEKIIPGSGPTAFLGRHYLSVFDTSR